MIGAMELILIVFVIIILFGANKIPEFAKAIGKSIGEYKKAKIEIEKEVDKYQKEIVECQK